MYRGALALAVAMLTACAAPPSPPAAGPAQSSDHPRRRGPHRAAIRRRRLPIACTPPRPEVCTMIYAPVCATLADNVSQKQYSSPCNACADDRVVAYREGACE